MVVLQQLTLISTFLSIPLSQTCVRPYSADPFTAYKANVKICLKTEVFSFSIHKKNLMQHQEKELELFS